MRRTFLIGILLTMITGLASAQTAREHHGYGYGFGAPGASVGDGGSNATLHFGVGGERLVYKGLGAGGEIGYVGSMTDLSAGIGVGSGNASYHFKTAASSGKLDPFLTGGYSLAFRSDVASGFNVGGGVDYWFKERLGLRVEVRDHVFPVFRNMNLIGVRIGLTFR
jgi:hypothetical protein